MFWHAKIGGVELGVFKLPYPLVEAPQAEPPRAPKMVDTRMSYIHELGIYRRMRSKS